MQAEPLDSLNGTEALIQVAYLHRSHSANQSLSHGGHRRWTSPWPTHRPAVNHSSRYHVLPRVPTCRSSAHRASGFLQPAGCRPRATRTVCQGGLARPILALVHSAPRYQSGRRQAPDSRSSQLMSEEVTDRQRVDGQPAGARGHQPFEARSRQLMLSLPDVHVGLLTRASGTDTDAPAPQSGPHHAVVSD